MTKTEKKTHTLWWTKIAMENQPFLMGKSTISMAIFHSYVSSLVAPARSTRNVPLQHAVLQRKGFWYDQHIWMHLLEDKKTSAKVPGFGGTQKYICCRMLFSRSSKCSKCICCNTRDFGMVDAYGCIYLKLKKASAKVLSFGGAQRYTCCQMLFSHSSKRISLGACARDKAFFTPPHI